MPKLPGVNHLRAIRALEKAGFQIDRQAKHVFLSKGARIVVVPCNNPIDAFTMAGIVKMAGLTIEEFKRLL
jgi:predicted RNA binding protein YcfA (HicA-like mRNA interferase family)